MREEPPARTITGAHGHTVIEPEVEFSPTSGIGDGALHVDGKLAGIIYADLRYTEYKAGSKQRPIWTFRALDENHQDLMAFNEQWKALEFLTDRARAER